MSADSDPGGKLGKYRKIPTRQERAVRAVERARHINRDWSVRSGEGPPGSWKRQTWTLPRREAREKAREFLRKYPRAAYWSEIESWRVLPGDRIEFTMRRLPSAD